jgi:dTDP-4-dehydrorhamnose reductase
VLARWAADHDVPIIHVSTDYVFDGAGEAPLRETDAPGPQSIYGESKLAGENEVRAAGGTSLVVRISWIYAAAGRNFLTTMARLAAERTELRVVDDQYGAPTSAAFVATALAAMVGGDLAAFRERCGRADGLVHLAAGGVTTWHAFAVAIVEGLRARDVRITAEKVTPIATAEYPTPARRPHNSRLALQRLKDVFNIEPPPWQTLLAAELDDFAQRNAAVP